MPEKKPSTGTPSIVGGSILIAWGFLAALRAVLIADPYGLAGLLLVGLGVFMLLRGLNARRRHESRSAVRQE